MQRICTWVNAQRLYWSGSPEAANASWSPAREWSKINHVAGGHIGGEFGEGVTALRRA